MSRSDQKQVMNTSMANSKQDQANAQGALQGVGAGLKTFQSGLDDYLAADPFKPGGSFTKDESNVNASRAQAYSDTLGDELDSVGKRTGENTAGYKNVLEQGTAKATRDEAAAQSASDEKRAAAETAYSQFGVDAQKFPVQANESVYGTSIGGANNALQTSEQAAKTPSIWDEIFKDAIAGVGSAGEVAAA